MQYQGPSRDKDKREQERSELRLLIGKNIARHSQLEGVDIDMYTKVPFFIYIYIYIYLCIYLMVTFRMCYLDY